MSLKLLVRVSRSKVAALGLVLLDAGHGFVVPTGRVRQEVTHSSQTAAPAATASVSDSAMYGAAMVATATAAAGVLARSRRTSKVARKALHGIKFPYSIQKDSHADLEFQNDIGCLASTRSQDVGHDTTCKNSFNNVL